MCSSFKKLLTKLGFQKLNKILISQVRFFDSIIIFQSTKMLAQIANLRLCALMSVSPYVLATLCPVPFCLRPYVGFRVNLHPHLSEGFGNTSYKAI